MTNRRTSAPSRTPLRDRCAKSAALRIETSSKYAWRTDLSDEAGQLDENTCSGAVDGTCEFTRKTLLALERAVGHAEMTEELAEILIIRVTGVETDVTVR
jgi:hypothetical protein